ncbi:hypothetical protein [Sulfurimonas sp.]|uniref:hypothetical protein n=1 Tax=Sulfurimonas sp. TaxID=2022749 RepID=UPI002AAFF6D0|nr:hypothetical protein [Sulfurimonas sp.]
MNIVLIMLVASVLIIAGEWDAPPPIAKKKESIKIWQGKENNPNPNYTKDNSQLKQPTRKDKLRENDPESLKNYEAGFIFE